MIRKHWYIVFLWILIPVICRADIEQKSQIYFTSTELPSGRWMYNYDVTNLSITEGIGEFTIWFDYNLYKNLVIETYDPFTMGWHEIVWQPDLLFQDFGGYDAIAVNIPILTSETVAGFAVSFDWLGNGIPGSQYYDIIDPLTLQNIDSGTTVPEPLGIMSLIVGIGLARRTIPTKGSSK